MTSPADPPKSSGPLSAGERSPVHVVYGGADRFSSDTPQKLGRIALHTLSKYAPDAVALASAMQFDNVGLAALVHERVIDKLRREPVEDFRIDFEDGYGFRGDDEEDGHAAAAAKQLAGSMLDGSVTPFSGFRIKPLAAETRERAERTLNIFLDTLLARTGGTLPGNFVVTLPKISDRHEVKRLAKLLDGFEQRSGLDQGSIGVEIMIETPLSLVDRKGRLVPARLVNAAGGRCTSAHFGAYDHTALLGIAADHQDIGHPACDFARQIMLATLSPLGLRLADSVTTLMPIPPHVGNELTDEQLSENRDVVCGAWRRHFENISRSMANGFYQSWDLHPNQLIARYAAVYAFFLRSKDAQGTRLRGFIEKATKAHLTGNIFDDAASAQGIVNFFRRAADCGALSGEEIEASAGLTLAEIRRGSFMAIMDGRRH